MKQAYLTAMAVITLGLVGCGESDSTSNSSNPIVEGDAGANTGNNSTGGDNGSGTSAGDTNGGLTNGGLTSGGDVDSGLGSGGSNATTGGENGNGSLGGGCGLQNICSSAELETLADCLSAKCGDAIEKAYGADYITSQVPGGVCGPQLECIEACNCDLQCAAACKAPTGCLQATVAVGLCLAQTQCTLPECALGAFGGSNGGSNGIFNNTGGASNTGGATAGGTTGDVGGPACDELEACCAGQTNETVKNACLQAQMVAANNGNAACNLALNGLKAAKLCE